MTSTPEAQAPHFAITADKDGNELAVGAQGDTVLIEVHSQSGIGSATVELVSGKLPQDIVLQLHLRGLEQFRLLYDGMVVTASVSSSDISNINESATSTEGGEHSIEQDSPLWLDIRIVSSEGTPRIPLDQGYFEIMLPKNFLNDGRRSFSIQWVDFYR